MASTLVARYTFESGVPSAFMIRDGERVDASNVQAPDPSGFLSLHTRQVNSEWDGGSVILTTPFTYGRVRVKAKLEQAHWTKNLMMLWPVGPWPPEIDFLELGNDAWDRQKNRMSIHYAPDNRIVGRMYDADLTRWHIYGVELRRDYITFRFDGKIITGRWGYSTKVVNEGINVPMTLRLTNWPTNNPDNPEHSADPDPDRPSKMQIAWIEVYT